ncbi:hypothetical protein CC80DRAFT_540380 [Byssothecium circinans]|uniref:Uncharacterized protein n=1 Tax=Byssothecium circinans TaxID=147558 RepID=A0A6A5TBZ8_9PLEO|nr:hypothetical protein CC80DRAFT_540380 [Byssothecium circinans]
MCRYTYTFYECGHRIEDNVQGCWRYKGGEAHCDVDNPQIKKTRCSVDVQNRDGFCPRCIDRQRTRREEEAFQRDVERARRLDAEEQERSRLVHESHLKSIQRQSYHEYRSEEDQTLKRVLEESRRRAELDLAETEAKALEVSRKEYLDRMEDSFGAVLEDGSTQLEAIKHRSTVDRQHREWSDFRGSQPMGAGNVTAQLEVKMSSSFSMKEGRHVSEVRQDTEPRTGRSLFSTESASYASSKASTIPPPPPPSILPASFSASIQSSASRQSAVSSSSTAIPPPPPLPPSFTTLKTAVRTSHTEDSKRFETASSTTASPPPPPPPPPPPLPPPPSSGPVSPRVDYSQPATTKDQNYGRFKIGTRHQPIHPSQHLPQTSDRCMTPLSPQAPAPTARLAGTVAPSTTSSGGFAVPSGDQRNRLRPPAAVRRSTLRAPIATEQAPNELEALWSRRGIQREVDEDDVSACSVTPSQSASQVPACASSVMDDDKSGE